MLLNIKGKPVNIRERLVGRVTRDCNSKNQDSILLLESENVLNLKNIKFKAILTTGSGNNFHDLANLVSDIRSLDHLNEGDIVSIGLEGNVVTLYRLGSNHNTLLTTERCNSNCLMCSQPPRDRDDISIQFETLKKLIPLIPKDCQELGITGGEPTLMGDAFFQLLQQLKTNLPNTDLHLLTNGRSFAWNHMAERLGELDIKRLMLGIPLYSDFYQQHDYIVQAENAFYQTMMGLHNLARYDQRIEIRIVLHKQSIPRLKKLAQYIYKNLPFAEHVAFMGLEYIGYTPHNIDKLWVDPYDYKDELTEAVEYLAGHGMHVSIYNTPLCVLPEHAWQFARKSISDWKNEYLPECNSCSKFNDCGGLFRWNLKKHSEYIQPFLG